MWNGNYIYAAPTALQYRVMKPKANIPVPEYKQAVEIKTETYLDFFDSLNGSLIKSTKPLRKPSSDTSFMPFPI